MGYIAGLLSLETLEERVAAAFTARDAIALESLSRDLPAVSLRERVSRWVASLRQGSPETTLLIEIAAPPDSVRGHAWTIGRDLASNLRINHDSVSRQHAQLERRGDSWLLRDCGSTNGTCVNGWRIDEALIRPGDLITLGDVGIILD